MNPRTRSRTRWRDERSTPWRAAASCSRRTRSSRVAFGNAASLSIASTSDAPMYVVVNTRSERPRPPQCRSISVRNFSKPLSLMNAHKRSTESALSNSLRRCSSSWSPSALTIRLEAWSDPRGRSGACAGLATIAVSRSAFRRSSSSRSKTRGACECSTASSASASASPLAESAFSSASARASPSPSSDSSTAPIGSLTVSAERYTSNGAPRAASWRSRRALTISSYTPAFSSLRRQPAIEPPGHSIRHSIPLLNLPSRKLAHHRTSP